MNRKDYKELEHIFICYKHFAEDVTVKTPTRIKLNPTLKPVPTIVPDSQKVINLPPSAIFKTLKTPREPPTQRVFSEDQFEKFRKIDSISNLDDVITKKVPGILIKTMYSNAMMNECIMIYKLESN